MDTSHSWKRRFVAYVEQLRTSNGYVYLNVKIPVATANAIHRDAIEKGAHNMVYYADAFAQGLSEALTSAETKTLS
jgi:hypothetical protein